jgi:hypothetical protein
MVIFRARDVTVEAGSITACGDRGRRFERLVGIFDDLENLNENHIRPPGAYEYLRSKETF